MRPKVLFFLCFLSSLFGACRKSDGNFNNEINQLAGLYDERYRQAETLVRLTGQTEAPCRAIREIKSIAMGIDSLTAVRWDSLKGVTDDACLHFTSLKADAESLFERLKSDRKDFNRTHKKILKGDLNSHAATRQLSAAEKNLAYYRSRLDYLTRSYRRYGLAFNGSVKYSDKLGLLPSEAAGSAVTLPASEKEEN